MPIYNKYDAIKGLSYFQYGETGKKYYYKNLIEKRKSYVKALKQARVIHANRKYRK